MKHYFTMKNKQKFIGVVQITQYLRAYTIHSTTLVIKMSMNTLSPKYKGSAQLYSFIILPFILFVGDRFEHTY